MNDSNANSGALTLTDDNFDAQVLRTPGVTVVDFWAAWCQPCKALAPTIDDLATASGGQFQVGKLDVEANTGVAARYAVQSIPTVLFFRDGEVVETLVGVHSLQDYQDVVAKLASSDGAAPDSKGAVCDAGG